MSTPANDLNITQPGYVVFDGTATFTGRTFQAGSGITLTNASGVSGNTTIASTASLTDLHTARFIVASSTLGTGANFTSIASAIAAAQSTGVNSTVFIQPGTYTENLTLVPGVNLVAYEADAFTPNVTIVGTLTCTAAGRVSISGIRLQTNSAALLDVSGSNASSVNLYGCWIDCTNNTGITYSSSNSSSEINLYYCKGNLGTTGIAIFTSTSAGGISFIHCDFANTGGSSTANTVSTSSVTANYTVFSNPLSSSSTGSIISRYTMINCSTQNALTLTVGGTGTHRHDYCKYQSGSAAAISVSASCTLTSSYLEINSTNTNPITGSGTISYEALSFSGSGVDINTTTQTARTLRYGFLRSTLQPSFLASAAAQNLVTGDNTTYTVQFTTVIRNQDSDFDGTSTFTAPVTGSYLLCVELRMSGIISSQTNGNMTIVTSNRSYIISGGSTFAQSNASGGLTWCGSQICDMDAADTAVINLTVNNGTKVVNITTSTTHFSGNLLC